MLDLQLALVSPRGDHTPLRFITMCNNELFNGGYLCTSQYLFPPYL